MTGSLLNTCRVGLLLCALASASAWAQSRPSSTATVGAVPSLDGVWQGPYVPDTRRALGHDLPLTAYGKEKFNTVDTANDPTSYCLPVGPARAIQAPFPFQIVQSPTVVTILFEYQRTFRIIYLDGREHPKDWEPEWYGHSVGRWEGGDTLVVDTVNLNERSWIDTAGHQHSDKLRLTERFQKTDKDTIRWTVTFEDPVYFTEPWSITTNLKRQDTSIMSYACEENEKDRSHLDASKKSNQ
jgi:hypothetical protein